MYRQLIKPKNILKIMLTIITIWLVAATLGSTFSSYVESPDYSDEEMYYTELEDVSVEVNEEISLEEGLISEYEYEALDNDFECPVFFKRSVDCS